MYYKIHNLFLIEEFYYYIFLYDNCDSFYLILKIFLRFNLDSDVKIEHLAKLLKYDMSGADLHSICSKAWINAVRRLLQISNQGMLILSILYLTFEIKKILFYF